VRSESGMGGNMNVRMILGFVACLLWAQACIAEEPFTALKYRWFEWYREFADEDLRYEEVTIDQTGKVTVEFRDHNGKTGTYQFQMNAHELDGLKSLAETSEFFSLPESEQIFPLEKGNITIEMVSKKRRRLLRNPYDDEIEPLLTAFRKITDQQRIVSEIGDGNFSSVWAVNNRDTLGVNVFSPRHLLEPLCKALPLSDDAEAGLTVVAWITTEEEWLGFVSASIRTLDNEKKLIWISTLSGHPFYADIPKSHAIVLRPYLTKFLKDRTAMSTPPDSMEEHCFSSVCHFLVSQEYVQAIPVLEVLAKEEVPQSSRRIRDSARLAADSLKNLKKR